MKTALQIVDNMVTQNFSEYFISLCVTNILGVNIVYVSNCFLGITIESDEPQHTRSLCSVYLTDIFYISVTLYNKICSHFSMFSI